MEEVIDDKVMAMIMPWMDVQIAKFGEKLSVSSLHVVVGMTLEDEFDIVYLRNQNLKSLTFNPDGG